MSIITVRQNAPEELCTPDGLFSAFKREVHQYYAEAFSKDPDSLKKLDRKLSDATLATPFASLVDGFDLTDALPLRSYLAHRFGINESELPRPKESQIRTYTFNQAIIAFQQTAGVI